MTTELQTEDHHAIAPPIEPLAEVVVLRDLARRANGMSGADVERLVREARQLARRERRQLTYADLDRLLGGARPRRSDAMRQRMAVHEAGHAVARLVQKLGRVELITLAGPQGTAYVESIQDEDVLDTQDGCLALIQTILAGRAAEEVVFGAVLSGSGGSEASDLAKASRLAFAMEASLGFGARRPLLYREVDDWQVTIRLDPELAARVNERLENAYLATCALIRQHRDALDILADELLLRDTLEGAELARVIARAGLAAQREPPRR